ncbi:MAG: hypothetical protein P4M01_08500 [Acidobacteriota bacterium]|nr:hypothetical protein [Acidobacteriota bacterium]
MQKVLAVLLVTLMVVLPGAAQQGPAAAFSRLTVPAGTVLNVVLAAPLSSADTHVGGSLRAQMASPVVSGSQVAIPPGTYLEGRIEKISQKDDRVEIVLRAATLAFADGYAASVPGTVTVRSALGWWQPAPNSHRGLALLPLLLAPGVGAAIGAASGHDGSITPGTISGGQLVPATMTSSTRGRNAAIGLGIGAGIAAVGAALLMHAHRQGPPDFFFDTGTPMDATLSGELAIDAAEAAHAAATEPAAPIPQAPRPMPPTPPAWDTSSGICYGPDIPGTPAQVIPGTPATPDSPGTPDIVIPGMPPTPGPVVPCA